MKNILFILLCVFTTQLFSQTTQNTISEEKFGLLSCKNFIFVIVNTKNFFWIMNITRSFFFFI